MIVSATVTVFPEIAVIVNFYVSFQTYSVGPRTIESPIYQPSVLSTYKVLPLETLYNSLVYFVSGEAATSSNLPVTARTIVPESERSSIRSSGL